LVFARSATVGGQQFPVHWGGDCSANYESMAETLRGGLSLTLSGFGFWSHDISGFENTAPADLFKRWCAFGLLSTHSRLHGSSSYRVPWNFDEESNGVARFFVELKHRLMPYLYKYAVESSREGVPLMRAMVLEFSDDPACAYLDRQYLLGPSVLVAPIFSPDGNVSYYLPEGNWTNYISGETVEGGHWLNEHHDYLSLPLMVRPNSIICTGAEKSRPDYDYADSVTIEVFAFDDGGKAETGISDLKGETVSQISVERNGSTYTVKNSGSQKPWKVLLRGIHAGKAEGSGLTDTKEGLLVQANSGTETISIKC
jgi:alpha-D-xyloside xylohydrolase